MDCTQTEELAHLLINMVFDNRPIGEFEKLWEVRTSDVAWAELLHISYCEESYTRVGGDEGYLENPPIDYARLAYLKNLIDFLEKKGIKEAE